MTEHAHSQKQSVPVFNWLETRFLSRTSAKVNTSCVMMVPPNGGLLLFQRQPTVGSQASILQSYFFTGYIAS